MATRIKTADIDLFAVMDLVALAKQDKRVLELLTIVDLLRTPAQRRMMTREQWVLVDQVRMAAEMARY